MNLTAPFLGLARWIWLAGVALALVGAVLLAIHVHDRRVIAAHEAAQAAANAKASLEAERRANASAAALEAQREARSTQAQEAMRRAEDEHPAEAHAAAGPVSRAATERLRRPGG